MNNFKLGLFQTFGVQLKMRSDTMRRMAHRVKFTEVLSRVGVIEFLRSKGLQQSIYGADRKYRTTNVEKIREIVEKSWVIKKKYISDYYDCDDFALDMKADLASVFGITAVALVKGTEITTEANERISHRHNLFVATENGELDVFILEAQNGGNIRFQTKPPIVINNWKYKLGVIEF